MPQKQSLSLGSGFLAMAPGLLPWSPRAQVSKKSWRNQGLLGRHEIHPLGAASFTSFVRLEFSAAAQLRKNHYEQVGMLPLAPSGSPVLSSPDLSVHIAKVCLLLAPVDAADVLGQSGTAPWSKLPRNSFRHKLASPARLGGWAVMAGVREPLDWTKT